MTKADIFAEEVSEDEKDKNEVSDKVAGGKGNDNDSGKRVSFFGRETFSGVGAASSGDLIERFSSFGRDRKKSSGQGLRERGRGGGGAQQELADHLEALARTLRNDGQFSRLAPPSRLEGIEEKKSIMHRGRSSASKADEKSRRTSMTAFREATKQFVTEEEEGEGDESEGKKKGRERPRGSRFGKKSFGLSRIGGAKSNAGASSGDVQI